MTYQIYNPTVTSSNIVDAHNNAAGLRYVSNSSLAYYGGKYWAIMDGNDNEFTEGSASQRIWLATSTDAVTWSAAIQPFRNSTYCTNPITDTTIEWQPNLVVVGEELWCTWTGYYGYISKLSTPTGRWTNYRFEFNGEQVFMSTTVDGDATPGRTLRPTINGISDWLPYFTQNPIVLSTGVVLCPLTLESLSNFSNQTTASSDFIRRLKYATVFSTSDGTNWSMSRVDAGNFGDFCAWETFVVEDGGGYVWAYFRNLDARADDENFLLVAVSSDGGTTFSVAQSSKLLVPSTRGFARRVSDNRLLMTHIDHPQESEMTANSTISKNRVNGSVFVSMRGCNDFIPGVNFSESDHFTNYPQFIVNPAGDLCINYTSGAPSSTGTNRMSMKLVKVSPAPNENQLYVHPRSLSLFDNAITDPTRVTTSPSRYDFNGSNQLVSQTSVTATTGLTFSAWLKYDHFPGYAVIDARQGINGCLFRMEGLTIRSLNLTHGFTLPPGKHTFLAAVLDNSGKTVTMYAANGGNFVTKTAHFRSVSFSGQPTGGDTVTINGVTYTFRASASVANEVTIGATVATTITNLATAISATISSSVVSPGTRLVMAKTSDLSAFTVTSGSSQITVDSTIDLTGGPAYFGRAISTSSVQGYFGSIYDAQIHDSALTAANITNLHNSKASLFGYSNISGTSTAPSAPLLCLDPENPNPTEFPPVGLAHYCEVVDASTLRIHGEGSASVELPYGANSLTISYKLGAAPSSLDKYVIATFGTSDSPARLYIDGSNPTSLYCNGREVSTVSNPTSYNTLTLTVSTNKISISTNFEQVFAGKPRCFLGNGYPQGLLASTKYVDYDVSAMTAIKKVNTL